jgi:hypothetical protein
MISTHKKSVKIVASSTFMKPPIPEVYCDHEKSSQRIRGWLKGIVVQVDYKMVAVQFRTNVFLTDGWMVPDHILWFPVHSEHIRFPLHKSTRAPLPKAY